MGYTNENGVTISLHGSQLRRELSQLPDTSIREENGDTIVRFHDTDVVTFNDTCIYLNTDGFKTSMNKTRINQIAHDFSLGFEIRQKKGMWIVRIKGSDYIYVPGRRSWKEINKVEFKFDSDDISFYNPNSHDYRKSDN